MAATHMRTHECLVHEGASLVIGTRRCVCGGSGGAHAMGDYVARPVREGSEAVGLDALQGSMLATVGTRMHEKLPVKAVTCTGDGVVHR